MSDFKSKLPSFQELTHMAGKLFKDVKNSVSELIDEYKQKRSETAQSDNANSTVSSNDVTSDRPTTTTSTSGPNDIHHDKGTTNPPNPTTPPGSSSTQPLNNSTAEAQTVEPLDELTPTDAGVGYQSTEKKTTKRKQKTAPTENNLDNKETTKPSSADVEIEHHVDEQKPLKDDVL
ncbi:hypothetical protein ACQUW5_06470 [Legionella sp. CNM-1927-20]|uniref:hypothetical protein n=1 Tax=Legionella sp. CNM-1927-20 TaxID=3422221 RepID=UPI00403A8505